MQHVLARMSAPIILAVSLAACGGGGGSGPTGGGSVPPTVPTGHATLVAGFSSGGLRSSGKRRGVRDVTAAIVPTAIIDFPDAYEAPFARSVRGIEEVFAVAYLATSGGGTVPTPLPSGTWTQSGIGLNTSPFTPGPTFSTTPNILPDGLAVNNTAATFGTTTFTDTVTGFGTATATVLEYPSLGLATASTAGDYINPQTFAANGLAFGSNGLAMPATTTTAADLYMTEDASGVTTVHFPFGGVVLPIAPTSIDQMLTPVTALPLTAISSQSLANNQSILQFQTTGGEIVKWQPSGFIDEHTGPTTCGTGGGCATHITGIYMVTHLRVWSM